MTLSMNKVTLCENTLDPSTWTVYENIADVPAFLVDHFGVWPDTARVYLDHVSNRTDVTPYDQAGIERLTKAKGHFFVVVYPQGIETIFVIIAIAVAAVALALVFIFRPTAKKNQNEQSPNNSLSNRKNEARPNERIPDIFGQVWATFDLLQFPYRTFESNIEIEHNYMCIGRGEYDLDYKDIRDDITPLYQTDGCQVAVFGPNNSPNSSIPAPFITIGAPITERVINIQPFGSVNGQTLRAPNKGTWQGGFPGPGNIRFVYPNKIQNNIGFDFNKSAFVVGDEITIGGFTNDGNDDLAVDPLGAHPSLHMGGQYFISSISGTEIQLTNPAAINANWTSLAAFDGGAGDSTYRTIYMIDNGIFSAGPFTILNADMTEFWCNFVAEQGSYMIDKDGNQFAVNSIMQVTVQQCDSTGAALGAQQYYFATIVGSKVDRQQKGTTLKINIGLKLPGFAGIIVSAKRISETDMTKGHTVSDEVQWRDAYVVSPVTQADFGNITSIQSIIRPTPAALAIKERKQNALVTRKIPSWTGSAFGAIAPTKNAALIFCAMALDSLIGNRVSSEVDAAQIIAILGTGGTVETYFGSSDFTEFCYTFDDSKISFEESVNDLAQAVFCVAFRRGSVLQVSFEAPTVNSVLLFNHRNKVPKSETRTVTFGTPTDNDGINLDYIEPNAPNFPNLDTLTTLYFPADQSAVNPKKITAVGVRNKKQATALGSRLYNKLRFQNTITVFEATEEAALLVLNDRILVADNTRSDTQDGEVIDQVVLELTLSQKVVFDGVHTYSIFLQHPDGTVENIAITPGSSDRKVVLALAPSVPCVIDPNVFARTTYQIVNNAPTRTNAFLLTEKNPKDNKTFEVKAINYADEYYADDIVAPGGGAGNPPIFMPTTSHGPQINAWGVPAWPPGTPDGSVYGDAVDLGPNSGTLERWESHSLAGVYGPDVEFFYSPPGVYGAPGSDDLSVPLRSQIDKIYMIMRTYKVDAPGGYNATYQGRYSLDNWATSNGMAVGTGDAEIEFAVDVTAIIVAMPGGIANFDFTQASFAAIQSSSENGWPVLLPNKGKGFFSSIGMLFTFIGGAGYGGGGGLTGGGSSGSGPGSSTGYSLDPANALSQPDSTHIDMADVHCNYLPVGPNVVFNSRSWVIADPGIGGSQIYYVSVYDPTHVGDALGTLTSFIGTSLASVHDGEFGYVTIGSITAVHFDVEHDIDNLTPTGTINGSNTAFTLPHAPDNINDVLLNSDGTWLTTPEGFTIVGTALTLVVAPVTTLRIWYEYTT